MRQSTAEMYTKFMHKMRTQTSQRVHGLADPVLCW